MKEFKTFVVSLVFFFLLWIAISYLFAGTLVLVTGFSESFNTCLQYPLIFCASFLGALLSSVLLGDGYYSHLKTQENG